jgi:hypothetical protein
VFLLYYAFMQKSTAVLQKKRGRPKTGETPVLAIRLSSETRAMIDEWADRQEDRPNRSEAMRRLVDRGIRQENEK